MQNFFNLKNSKYNRNFLITVIISTWITSSIFLFAPEKNFEQGIIFSLAFLGEILSFLLIAIFMIPKIKKFEGYKSIGDVLSNIYGKSSRIWVGFIAILTFIIELSVQSTMLGYILHYFFRVNLEIGLLLAISSIILYSNFCSEKTIASIYLFNLSMLLITLPIICNISVSDVGGYQNLAELVKNSPLFADFIRVDYIKYISSFILFSLPSIHPNNIQRFLTGESTYQLISALKYVILIGLIFYICIIFMISSVSLLRPNLDPLLTMLYIIKNSLPTSIKGLAIAGLVSIIISSADSTLNSFVICLIYDVIKPLSKKKITENTEFNLAKAGIIIAGILSSLISFRFETIYILIIIYKVLWIPLVTMPIILGISKYKEACNATDLFIISNIFSILLCYMFFSNNLSINMTCFMAILLNYLFYLCLISPKPSNKDYYLN